MPVIKRVAGVWSDSNIDLFRLCAEAHRALELLEEYHSRLTSPSDKPLRLAIERVIRIFKSQLFQALLDIQEFYETTLLDESKSSDQKTREALGVASQWENSQSRAFLPQGRRATSIKSVKINETVQVDDGSAANIGSSLSGGSGGSGGLAQGNGNLLSGLDTVPIALAPPSGISSPEEPAVLKTFRQISHSAPPTELAASDTAESASGPGEWETDEVILHRGESGFGFSIAGGSDNAHAEGDPAIYVTRVVDSGPAALDGRLHLNDVIVAVNNFSVEYVTHSEAVEALKRSGKVLHLLVRRQRAANGSTSASVVSSEPRGPSEALGPVLDGLGGGTEASGSLTGAPVLVKVELTKRNRGLGFSIAGGRGNEHVAGDPGIFITKVIENSAAAADGRIAVGDRLVRVSNTSLENVTHEEAVAALKATGDTVHLVFAKAFDGSAPGYELTSSSSFPSNLHSNSDNIYVDPGDSVSVTMSEDLTREPRRFFLKKGDRGLGFNIVGGENGEGIFVSYILPGGPADHSRHLRKGDQLIAVNGVDLTNATHEEAAAVLKSAGETVEVIAAYKPEEYEVFESKVQDIREQLQMPSNISSTLFNASSAEGSSEAPSPRLSVYVRALFDYDATKDTTLPSKGLSFVHGDILHLINASDEEWWRARMMPLCPSETPRDQDAIEVGSLARMGLIPSKRRVERRERSRLKRVNFHQRRPSAGGLDLCASDSLDKKKKSSLLRKLTTSSNVLSATNRDMDSGAEDKSEDAVLSYEVVRQVEITYARPLIVFGPLNNRINDDLLNEFPNKFGSCVPHTTRPRRDHEIDGRDYHFVTSREQMEKDIQAHLFIEAGQYNNNLYGTSVLSVREVAETGRHCMLDVSGNAIRRLQLANLSPIAIFVRPRSVEHVLQLSPRLTEEQAKKVFDRAMKLEADFFEYFTAIVTGETPEEIYQKVKEVIRIQAGPKIWVPATEEQQLIN